MPLESRSANRRLRLERLLLTGALFLLGTIFAAHDASAGILTLADEGPVVHVNSPGVTFMGAPSTKAPEATNFSRVRSALDSFGSLWLACLPCSSDAGSGGGGAGSGSTSNGSAPSAVACQFAGVYLPIAGASFVVRPRWCVAIPSPPASSLFRPPRA
jgi:hypothetical protein